MDRGLIRITVAVFVVLALWSGRTPVCSASRGLRRLGRPGGGELHLRFRVTRADAPGITHFPRGLQRRRPHDGESELRRNEVARKGRFTEARIYVAGGHRRAVAGRLGTAGRAGRALPRRAGRRQIRRPTQSSDRTRRRSHRSRHRPQRRLGTDASPTPHQRRTPEYSRRRSRIRGRAARDENPDPHGLPSDGHRHRAAVRRAAPDEAVRDVRDWFETVEAALSRFRPESELSRC